MLVQLVCLDRRYQRMNCYNIREIQTILKSKYNPNLSEPAEVHFNLDDTTVGLRYQLASLDFIDFSTLTYYKNALVSHPRYQALHEFLNKPIVEFDSVKLFMSRASLMFSVLETIYKDQDLDSLRMLTANGPVSTSVLIPAPSSSLRFTNFETSFTANTSTLLSSELQTVFRAAARPAAFSFQSFVNAIVDYLGSIV